MHSIEEVCTPSLRLLYNFHAQNTVVQVGGQQQTTRTSIEMTDVFTRVQNKETRAVVKYKPIGG